MAYFDQTFFHTPRFGAGTFLSRVLDTPFDRRSRDIARRIAELRALSDAELAARGLSRGDIVRHVLLTRRG